MKRWLYVFVAGIWITACKSADYRYTEGPVYGTYYRVVYQSEKDLDRDIEFQMDRVNVSLSMFNDSSVISKLNRGESRQTDSLFCFMYTTALRIYRETEGAFDITVAPLANAWGFGYKHDSFPTPEKIDSLRRYVGMDKLRLENGELYKEQEGMEIDASSIAKGLGVDLVAGYLEHWGVENYMVDIGGEIRVKGVSGKGRPWRIGIDKPIDNPEADGRELQTILALGQGALATSGNYRNFYIHEGKKYAHTIDPRTGYPVQRDILSSTVYAPSCMEADAYATAFMVLGLEKSKKIVENHPGLEACFVYFQEEKNGVWMSPAFEKRIVK